MKKILLLLLIALNLKEAFSQNIGINATGALPHTSAMLDVNSTNKGVLMPRMTTAQRTAIASPATGLLVFDLDKSTIYLFDGQKWQPMLFTSSDSNNPPITRSASDGTLADRFGVSVSIAGDYAIIGAYNEDIGGNTDQGAAYIFTRQSEGWKEQAKLIAADGGANDNFGINVSISGDYAIIGSPKATGVWTLQGAAYIFFRSGTTWSQQARLTAADGIIGDFFGTSVSIDGDYAIIGTPNARLFYANQGAAYIFIRNSATWSQQAKLSYAGGQFNDYFGNSVTISGNYAVIGTPYFDWFFPNQGAAFVFVRSGTVWTSQQMIIANDGLQDDYFGSSVSIHGDYIVAGAPNDDGAFVNQGSAYIFNRSGTAWTQRTKIVSDYNQAEAYFGYSVSINNNDVIIGAIYDNTGVGSYLFKAGAAYIYHRTANLWELVRTVNDGGRQSSGFFGGAVGVSGYNYIIGAFGKNNARGEISFLNIE